MERVGKIFKRSMKEAAAEEKARELSWVPVRHGNIFCSPRCGMRCTWAEHQLAHKRADELVAKMNTFDGGKGGWEKRVWENGGWHHQVFKVLNRGQEACIEIHEEYDLRYGRPGTLIGYSAWFQPGKGCRLEGTSHGHQTQIISKYYQTPFGALQVVLDAMENQADWLKHLAGRV